jgi:hypothetical protein
MKLKFHFPLSHGLTFLTVHQFTVSYSSKFLIHYQFLHFMIHYAQVPTSSIWIFISQHVYQHFLTFAVTFSAKLLHHVEYVIISLLCKIITHKTRIHSSSFISLCLLLLFFYRVFITEYSQIRFVFFMLSNTEHTHIRKKQLYFGFTVFIKQLLECSYNHFIFLFTDF